MFISLIYSLSVFRHMQGGEPASVCSLALNPAVNSGLRESMGPAHTPPLLVWAASRLGKEHAPSTQHELHKAGTITAPALHCFLEQCLAHTC